VEGHFLDKASRDLFICAKDLFVCANGNANDRRTKSAADEINEN
jgi:hypothetical protein